MIKLTILIAAFVACMLLPEPASAGGVQGYGKILFFPHHHHHHHLIKPPPASTPAKTSAAVGGGSSASENWKPAVAGGFVACVFGKAVDEKSRAANVGGVYKTTYRQEAETFGACIAPIPVERRKTMRGHWTLGGSIIWFLTGRHEGYADPDFAIRQMEARDRIK